jgi:hypothetical protein
VIGFGGGWRCGCGKHRERAGGRQNSDVVEHRFSRSLLVVPRSADPSLFERLFEAFLACKIACKFRAAAVPCQPQNGNPAVGFFAQRM